MLIVHGSVTIQKAFIDEAMQLSKTHVARSRAEPGCIEHGVYLDPEVEGRLVFVEKWKDEAALQQHFSVPESIDFVNEIRAIAIDEPAISIFEATEWVS